MDIQREREEVATSRKLKIFHMNLKKFQRIHHCEEIHKLFQAYTITLNIFDLARPVGRVV